MKASIDAAASVSVPGGVVVDGERASEALFVSLFALAGALALPFLTALINVMLFCGFGVRCGDNRVAFVVFAAVCAIAVAAGGVVVRRFASRIAAVANDRRADRAESVAGAIVVVVAPLHFVFHLAVLFSNP